MPSTVTRALLVSSSSGPQVISLVAWPAAAAQQRADAGQHFFHVERLGDIIVGAGIEARHLVAPAVARGEDEHRHLLAGAAPFFQHADAIEHRQAEIENHRVIGFGVAEEMAFLAVHGLVDHIARIGQGRRPAGGSDRDHLRRRADASGKTCFRDGPREKPLRWPRQH